MDKWTNEDLISQLITRANQVSIISESNEIAEMRAEVLRRLSALDTPAPPEDVWGLAKQNYLKIQSGEVDSRLFPSVHGLFEALEKGEELTEWDKGRLYGFEEAMREQRSINTAYADSIRKECADRYCEHKCAWPPREWEHPDECECSDRAAIMRKE